MRTFTIVVCIIFIASNGFAQNGINYKAVIKDNIGNVVGNQNVTVRFSILKGVGQTLVYSENHTRMTDLNGLVIANIGEGTPTNGVYGSIVWGSDKHYLKVEVNTGAGLINMGNTEFKAVPYALNVTGLEQITENGNTGWRLKGRNPANYGNIGTDAIDLSHSGSASIVYGAAGTRSLAMGQNTQASGSFSTAMGYFSLASSFYSTAMGQTTQASGTASIAMGQNTIASGSVSTAMGQNTIASGEASIAMGHGTEASGYYCTALGYFTKASANYGTSIGNNTRSESFSSLAIGRYNLGGGTYSNWIATDPIFEIGNGSSVNNRSNALTVLKNGNIGISTPNPTVKLQITEGSDASLSAGSGFMVLGNFTGNNLVLDSNEIMARNNGNTANLYLQQDGGNVYVGGALVHSSDRRLKEDITDLKYGLNEILQLQPKSYYWKNRDHNQKSFGLIAQEVQPIMMELVLAQEDEDKTLSVNYTELIPILIKAIQEQQEIIHIQDYKINTLTADLDQLKILDTRIKQLESLLKLTNQ